MSQKSKEFLEKIQEFIPSTREEYFEEVAHSDDPHLVNIFSTTVLEILGNDKAILETAKKYMGSKTMQLQIEADIELGRRYLTCH